MFCRLTEQTIDEAADKEEALEVARSHFGFPPLKVVAEAAATAKRKAATSRGPTATTAPTTRGPTTAAAPTTTINTTTTNTTTTTCTTSNTATGTSRMAPAQKSLLRRLMKDVHWEGKGMGKKPSRKAVRETLMKSSDRRELLKLPILKLQDCLKKI